MKPVHLVRVRIKVRVGVGVGVRARARPRVRVKVNGRVVHSKCSPHCGDLEFALTW